MTVLIKKKITGEAFLNGDTITSAENSYRILHCQTLGDYKLKIDYSFVPKVGDNNVKIHFWGTHIWNDSSKKGKPFVITYEFYDVVTIKIEAISNLFDATNHYADHVGSGHMLSAVSEKTTANDSVYESMKDDDSIASLAIPSEELYEEMKNDETFTNMIRNIKNEILGKITDEVIDNGETISDSKSYDGVLHCKPLGRYSVNYEYSFVPKKGENKIKIHFWGKDPWDFYVHKSDVLITSPETLKIALENTKDNFKNEINS